MIRTALAWRLGERTASRRTQEYSIQDPSSAQLNAAIELMKRGRLAEAEAALQELQAQHGPNPGALFYLGMVYGSMGRWPEAAKALQAVLDLRPDIAPAHYQFGVAMRALGNLPLARRAFEEALRLGANRLSTSIVLAQVLGELGEHGEAAVVLAKAAAENPNAIELVTMSAETYSRLGRQEEAERAWRRALALDPRAGADFGFWLQQQGRFEESVPVFEMALEAMPIQGGAYFGLSEARAFHSGDRALAERAAAVLPELAEDPEERAYLCYAIARAYEADRNFESAMRFFDLGNEAANAFYNAGSSYDPAARASQTDATIARYDRATLARGAEGASPSDRPILIVGMIRSGTTLLDQMLSCHPAVRSAGEPGFWLFEAERVRQTGDSALSSERVADLADRYLQVLEREAGASPRITDKMPLNYLNLGLIHLAFPRAKVVHLRRNPLDTCLSIYTTFLRHGPSYAYSQRNIVSNYREYMRLMEHWRSALPANVMLEVDYENLVADREAVMRAVTEFCGLAWDPDCLQPESNPAPIRTPSTWQARQPVYRTSVERWRQYEPWLGQLAELKGSC